MTSRRCRWRRPLPESRAGTLSPVDLVEAYLDTDRANRSRDSRVHHGHGRPRAARRPSTGVRSPSRDPHRPQGSVRDGGHSHDRRFAAVRVARAMRAMPTRSTVSRGPARCCSARPTLMSWAAASRRSIRSLARPAIPRIRREFQAGRAADRQRLSRRACALRRPAATRAAASEFPRRSAASSGSSRRSAVSAPRDCLARVRRSIASACSPAPSRTRRSSFAR